MAGFIYKTMTKTKITKLAMQIAEFWAGLLLLWLLVKNLLP
jgi:hypothetical protein